MSPTVKRTLAALKPGDAVEIVWNDANTTTKWVEATEAANTTLSPILTRGTFVRHGDGAVRVALDAAFRHSTGALEDFHGVGTIDMGSITEVYKLERKRLRAARNPRVKK